MADKAPFKIAVDALTANVFLPLYRAVCRARGCVHAAEINAYLAAEEPFDVPLEYRPPASESKG